MNRSMRPSAMTISESVSGESPFSRCAPLVILADLFENYQAEEQQSNSNRNRNSNSTKDLWSPVVAICLHEPLHAVKVDAEPVHVSELFSLCAQLSLLWQREGLVRLSEGATFAPNRFNEGAIAQQVVEQLNDACTRFQPRTPMKDVLIQNGLARFFPPIAANLCPGEPAQDNQGIAALNEYFAHMRLLHQIYAITQQLLQDVQMSNHKYIAHQVALLYQSLNQARLPFEQYKRRVESRFEALKAVTEQSQNPILPESHRQWLIELCTELSQIIISAPRPLTRRVQPWLDIVRRNAS